MRDTRLWGFVDSCRGETEALLMWGRIIPLRPVSMPLHPRHQTSGSQTLCCGLGQAPIPRPGVPSRPSGSLPGWGGLRRWGRRQHLAEAEGG